MGRFRGVPAVSVIAAFLFLPPRSADGAPRSILLRLSRNGSHSMFDLFGRFRELVFDGLAVFDKGFAQRKAYLATRCPASSNSPVASDGRYRRGGLWTTTAVASFALAAVGAR